MLELMLTVSILIILVALLMPALRNMKSSAKKAVCVSNLRQIGVGLASYSNDNQGYFPPLTTYNGLIMTPGPGQNTVRTNFWYYHAWNYFGGGPYKRNMNDVYRYDYAPVNIFCCPVTMYERIHVPTMTLTPYAYINYTLQAGPWTSNNIPSYLGIPRGIIKNASETALIIEGGSNYIQPYHYFDQDGLIPHQAGMNTLFYDGHVAYLRFADIPPASAPFWTGK